MTWAMPRPFLFPRKSLYEAGAYTTLRRRNRILSSPQILLADMAYALVYSRDPITTISDPPAALFPGQTWARIYFPGKIIQHFGFICLLTKLYEM